MRHRLVSRGGDRAEWRDIVKKHGVEYRAQRFHRVPYAAPAKRAKKTHAWDANDDKMAAKSIRKAEHAAQRDKDAFYRARNARNKVKRAARVQKAIKKAFSG